MKNYIEQIQQRIEQLEQLGYHPSQVKNMMLEQIGKTALTGLTDEQNEALADMLDEYIEFALKCRKVR